MGKRHPNLPAWQWRNHPQNPQHATNHVLQLLALPLMVIGFLLMVSGVFSENMSSVAIGVVGILAALALQHHGRRLEAHASDTSSDQHLLV
ncbi:terminase [Pseudomonas sp. IPO3778]|nr:terminase [Pseudomonas sp. IPO3779]NWD17115.1 terminase [Pseudomonas sp. IPO3778]NWE37341.1 terminase [Pseudomonas gingeri]